MGSWVIRASGFCSVALSLVIFTFSTPLHAGIGDEKKAEAYLGLYDGLLTSLKNWDEVVVRDASKLGRAFHYGKDQVYANEGAFFDVFRETLGIYLETVKQECPTCLLPTAEKRPSWIKRQWLGFKHLFIKGHVLDPIKERWEGIERESAHMDWLEGLLEGKSMNERARIMAKWRALHKRLSSQKWRATWAAMRGKITEVRHEKGNAILLFWLFVYLPVSEFTEHFVEVIVPPNPVTCAAIQAAYFSVAGFVQNMCRVAGTSFASGSLWNRLANMARFGKINWKFRNRLKSILWAYDFPTHQSDYRKHLREAGHEIESELADSPFWGEMVSLALGQPGSAAPKQSLSNHKLDIAYLFSDAPLESRLARLDQHVHGFRLMKKLLTEAFGFTRSASEGLEFPMPFEHFYRGRGELGQLGKLISIYHAELFAVLNQNRGSEKERVVQQRVVEQRFHELAELNTKLRERLFKWEETVGQMISRLTGKDSCAARLASGQQP